MDDSSTQSDSGISPAEQLHANAEYIKTLTEDKCDPFLGAQVGEHLRKLGIECPSDPSYNASPQQAFDAIQFGIRAGLHLLGLNMDDASLADTPRRYAAMFIGELTKGLNYEFFPKCTTVPNGVWPSVTEQQANSFRLAEGIPVTKPEGAYNQMVLQKDIQVISLCEHHLQTIYGVAHIAYIPATKLLGLSKFARVTDFFSRRPQVQERLTEQIYEALAFILKTPDIAVVIKADHFCMKARGALQHASNTTTDKLGGRFFTNQSLREEFMNACR